MNRPLVMKIIIIVAILAALLVGYNMYNGKPATANIPGKE